MNFIKELLIASGLNINLFYKEKRGDASGLPDYGSGRR